LTNLESRIELIPDVLQFMTAGIDTSCVTNATLQTRCPEGASPVQRTRTTECDLRNDSYGWEEIAHLFKYRRLQRALGSRANSNELRKVCKQGFDAAFA